MQEGMQDAGTHCANFHKTIREVCPVYRYTKRKITIMHTVQKASTQRERILYTGRQAGRQASTHAQ